jgi:hypothetical protein
LDCHYWVNIIPIFFSEVLADLHEPGNRDRPPEQIVGGIASKISGYNSIPNIHHMEICTHNLLGDPVELERKPLVGGARVVTDRHGRRATYLPNPPEMEAFNRWASGDFLGVERDFARQWREDLNALDLRRLVAGMKQIKKSELRTLSDAKAAADLIVTGNGERFRVLRLALQFLGIPTHLHGRIIATWKQSGGPPLSDFAPYAAYVFKVDLFFWLGLAANLIGAERASHRIDLAYLYYLPFCRIFSSIDKFHKAIVPHFLGEDQMFLSGEDLKAELVALANHYEALPQDVRDKGSATYAAYPPLEGDFLTSRIFDRFFEGWRADAATPAEPRSPERDRAILERLRPMMDAIEALDQANQRE